MSKLLSEDKFTNLLGFLDIIKPWRKENLQSLYVSYYISENTLKYQKTYSLPNCPKHFLYSKKNSPWVFLVCARYYVLSHPFTRFSLRLRAQNARKSRAPPKAARERRQHSNSTLPGLLFQAFGGRARKRDSEFFGLFKRITFFLTSCTAWT